MRYLFAGTNTLRWLRTQDANDVVAIIAYHGSSAFLIRLHSICRKRRIRLLLDCTEWYDHKGFVAGGFGIVNLDNAIRMRLINPKIGQIIVISSYLERYYKARGSRVVRVPPLVDLIDSKWPPAQESSGGNHTLQLVYAGVPAKKDLLGNALRGMRILVSKGLPVILHLIGPSPPEVAECLGRDKYILSELENAVVFHGRIPQTDVPKTLACFDFSILLRPQERYAQAGFPTKLVESLSAGVPVIVNSTSDIPEYVRDAQEGILLSDHTVEQFVQGVTRVCRTDRSHWFAMRQFAKSRAQESFDFRSYVAILRDFLFPLDA